MVVLYGPRGQIVDEGVRAGRTVISNAFYMKTWIMLHHVRWSSIVVKTSTRAEDALDSTSSVQTVFAERTGFPWRNDSYMLRGRGVPKKKIYVSIC